MEVLKLHSKEDRLQKKACMCSPDAKRKGVWPFLICCWQCGFLLPFNASFARSDISSSLS